MREAPGFKAYERAHDWALQRTRLTHSLGLPTAQTMFGLGVLDDGVDAAVTVTVGRGATGADELRRIESAVLAVPGVNLVALVEPVGGAAAAVSITVRTEEYELQVLNLEMSGGALARGPVRLAQLVRREGGIQ